jgi:hypothetical protein
MPSYIGTLGTGKQKFPRDAEVNFEKIWFDPRVHDDIDSKEGIKNCIEKMAF